MLSHHYIVSYMYIYIGIRISHIISLLFHLCSFQCMYPVVPVPAEYLQPDLQPMRYLVLIRIIIVSGVNNIIIAYLGYVYNSIYARHLEYRILYSIIIECI